MLARFDIRVIRVIRGFLVVEFRDRSFYFPTKPEPRKRFFMIKLVCVIAVIAMVSNTASAETLAERILASYDPVQTVNCQIRKDSEAGGKTMRMLSRVYYEKPDRLHVDQPAPIPRRIVADGTTFYSYIEGDPRGFSRPVEKLNEEMTINLRKVPGTAMDHLMKLKGIAETNMEPTVEFPERKGYDSGKLFVVLSTDATGRLVRIEYYSSPAMKETTLQCDYSDFKQVAGGAWIPCLHRAFLKVGGVESRETTRVDNLVVNQPIPPGLFVAGPFFKDVDFVDNFEDVYR
jgi:hypothetical protein